MASPVGDINISDAKSATGIASNNLSDHDSGALPAQLSELMALKVGMPYGPQSDNWKAEIELINQPPCLAPGNRFTIRVYASVDLPFAADPPTASESVYGEQILQRQTICDPSVSNATLMSKTPGSNSNIEGNTVHYVDYEYKVDGYGKSDIDATVNDPLSDQATHMGTQLPLSQDDTSGTAVDNVTSNNQLDLITDTPKWDFLQITYESDPTGENVEYSATSTLHDPNDQIDETNRRYELEEIQDGETRVKEDTTNGLSDQVSWGNSFIATSSSSVDGNAISTFEFRVLRASDTSTVLHYVRFDVEWHDMSTGDTAIVQWNECSGPNVYESQNGYAERISNTTL